MVESEEVSSRPSGLFKPSCGGRRRSMTAGRTATLRVCGSSNLTYLPRRSPCMAIIESSVRTGRSCTKAKRSETVKPGVSPWEDTGKGEGFYPFDWLRRNGTNRKALSNPPVRSARLTFGESQHLVAVGSTVAGRIASPDEGKTLRICDAI